MVLLVVAAAAAVIPQIEAQDVGAKRDAKVRADKEKITGEGFWIYADLPRGIETAKASGKPLLVVFRCIPCEECVKLDDHVVERDPAVRALLEKFTCVRMPQTNGMDLSVFQFDYDQSWCAFFLNADLTVYGRYGTRSHRTESHDDVSIEGFARSLEAALDLHARHADVKASLAAKRGTLADLGFGEAKVPEALPGLAGRYTAALDYAGAVTKSCIHCHQVGEALRSGPRAQGRALPEHVLFPYPNPSVVGLVMDPKERARVRSVTPGSPASSAGFRAGDDIATFAGQPVVSTADLQWVLHRAGTASSIAAGVVREGKPLALDLPLPAGWRARSDISWRVSTWDLCRMTTGGMRLADLSAQERRAAKLADDVLALRVTHVGQWGAHAAAKNAGFRKDDVLVAVDGRTERLTETGWIASLMNRTKPGDNVTVNVRRNGGDVELKLPMQ